MFSFGHSGTSTSVDPDLERTPPPPPTVVYFPQNDAHFESTADWSKKQNHPPDILDIYSHIFKPTDVRLSHLKHLNIAIENDVSADDFMPVASDGLQHLPPRTWDPQFNERDTRNSSTYEVYAHSTYPILSNGTKAPELDAFNKFVAELHCDTDAGLRTIGKQKPKPGQKLPTFTHYKKFWTQLEIIASFWDTSSDHYYEVDAHQAHYSKGGIRSKLHASRKHEVDYAAGANAKVKRYKGRRTSTGSKMPDHFRNDAVRGFLEPLAVAFGCQVPAPRRLPLLQIKNLLIPVTQTAVIWRIPQDKGQVKRGFLEGPVLGVQCRLETNFLHNSNTAALDSAREIAGVLLLAQERAREGKAETIPGTGQWYTTKPRWGGGPGGEFGEAEGNKDTHSSSTHRFHYIAPLQLKSEEETWKELKAGPALYESRMTYLAVGKERLAEHDVVFMVSSIFHHISILKLEIHPAYLQWLSSGQIPSEQPNSPWYAPKIQRTKWYDLLDPNDRVEAMRVLWGVLSYSMRTGQQSEPLGHRQKSEISHAFPFRKKRYDSLVDTSEPPRSSSVAF